MKRPLALAALLAAIVLMGLSVFYSSPPGETFREGECITLSGRVIDVAKQKVYDTDRLLVYIDSVNLISDLASGEEAKFSYKLICQTEDGYRPRLGSRIRVTGQFQNFSQASNPGQFDLREYYRSLKIAGSLKNAQIITVSEEYRLFREKLYCFRQERKEALYRSLPEKEASVLCAMILGDKSELEQYTKELYTKSGIIHILSISGLHITLIGMGIFRMLRRMGIALVPAAFLGGTVLVLYAVMTGMGVSAQRAAGMFLLRMLAVILGRSYDMLTALGCVFFIMIWRSPEYLGNAGFILSFVSVCGIGTVLPELADQDCNSGEKKGRLWGCLKEKMMPGISVSLTTLPVILYFYHEIPIYSIIVNLLILPFVGILMAAGTVLTVFPRMIPACTAVRWILAGYRWVCEASLKLPGAVWNPGSPENWQTAVYYALLAAAVFGVPVFAGRICKRKRGLKKYLRVKIFFRWILIASAIVVLTFSAGKSFSVTFLDVGQGDCIVVRSGRNTWLFDCGSSSQNEVGEYVLLPFLKHQGIKHLDGVFISHPDEDHMNGILELMTLCSKEQIVIDKLILPEIPAGKKNADYEEIYQALSEMEGKKPETLYMKKGQSVKEKDTEIYCLHPGETKQYADENLYSMCLLIRSGGFSMLLTGDVEKEGERQLIRETENLGITDVDVLKVAHHGSGGSTSKELLELITPTAGVISCGKDNPYGHPHPELIERLENCHTKIFQTSECGAVTVRKKKDHMYISTFIEG